MREIADMSVSLYEKHGFEKVKQYFLPQAITKIDESSKSKAKPAMLTQDFS